MLWTVIFVWVRQYSSHCVSLNANKKQHCLTKHRNTGQADETDNDEWWNCILQWQFPVSDN